MQGQEFSSSRYWEDRYRAGKNSGSGSYGRLAEFKASVINAIVKDNKIKDVIEFGCGDGNQLKLAEYPKYHGFDVSETVVAACSKIYFKDKSKKLSLVSEYNGESADLVISLDVIYHLVEGSVFDTYMRNLFSSSRKFVVIYSSNSDDIADINPYVKHREFLGWIYENCPKFKLVEVVKNKYPVAHADIGEALSDYSYSDFFVFEKSGRLSGLRTDIQQLVGATLKMLKGGRN